MKTYHVPTSDMAPFLNHVEDVEDAFLSLLEAHPRLSRLDATTILLEQIRALSETAKRLQQETSREDRDRL